MTSKKRRQRGTRTHSGGSQKNRRGAGHRGGRGDAGREKHEFHRHDPLGKHGFKRPDAVQDNVVEVSIQKLDEDAVVLVEDGLAEETGDGYEIDARDVVEDGWEADAVKVLGNGQVRNTLTVTADAFTADAVALIEGADGEAVLSERAEEAEEADAESEGSQEPDNDGE